MKPNIPRNQEHHEALQAEVDKKRKEWLKLQSPEVQESILAVEEALGKCKIPVYFITFQPGFAPLHYNNHHQVAKTYDEGLKIYNSCISLILHDLQRMVTRDSNNIRIIIEQDGIPVKVYEKE